MFDYETLKLIWWLLVGVLLVGFAVKSFFSLARKAGASGVPSAGAHEPFSWGWSGV